MVKLGMSTDIQTGQGIVYIYSDTHDRQELRQAASACGIDPMTKYTIGFLNDPEPGQTEPTIIPLLHFNLEGITLEKAKSLFRLVDDEELANDLDKVFKIFTARLNSSR